MDARAANDRIAEKAERLNFVSRVPMLCECSDPACRTIVMVSLAEYRQLRDHRDNFLTAPGHNLDRGEFAEETPRYVIQRLRRQQEGNGHSA